jgi:early secretory antigenic target protein ESAT-6
MSERLVRKFGQMDQAVDLIRDANAGIRGSLERLDNNVDTLRGEWTGAASEAYDAAHREWVATLERMNGILAQSAQVVASAAERGRATQKSVQAKWGG